MGVHDYRCSLCAEPLSFECHEATGGECAEAAMGDDHAHLALYWFERATAPRTAAEFAARRHTALRVVRRTYGYDWAQWEFVPPLNYKYIALAGDETSGAWPVLSLAETHEGHEPSVDCAPDERVWAEVTCTQCQVDFSGTAPVAPCRERLRRVSEQTGLPFDGDKDTFVAAVRHLVAARRAP